MQDYLPPWFMMACTEHSETVVSDCQLLLMESTISLAMLLLLLPQEPALLLLLLPQEPALLLLLLLLLLLPQEPALLCKQQLNNRGANEAAALTDI
jgi:hypothetical protein